jgi:hypothetical protein
MWRKVLLICRKNSFICFLFLIFSTGMIYSEEKNTMPSFPDMPSFPEISAPSIDSSFYHPQISSSTYSNNSKTEENVNSTKKDSPILTSSDNNANILSNLISSNSTLTANDISSLYDSGLFSNLNSLSSNLSSGNTDVLLQKILTSLEELKTEQKNLSNSQNFLNSDKINDSKTFIQRSPNVLRFKINNYNLMNTLEKTFFSDTEKDGSFLFTADRKYYVNNKANAETFYILFKTKKSTGAATEYDVEVSLNQNTKNENSYIYKLMNMEHLKAMKTGNLLVMSSLDDKNSVDILLDIDLKQD